VLSLESVGQVNILALFFVNYKEGPAFVAHHGGEDVRREHFDGIVVVGDGGVVGASCGGNLLFKLREGPLEVHEAVNGLEVWVIFDNDHEPGEGLCEDAIKLDHLVVGEGW